MGQRRRATSGPPAVVPYASAVGGACVLDYNRQIRKEDNKTSGSKEKRGQGKQTKEVKKGQPLGVSRLCLLVGGACVLD